MVKTHFYLFQLGRVSLTVSSISSFSFSTQAISTPVTVGRSSLILFAMFILKNRNYVEAGTACACVNITGR